MEKNQTLPKRDISADIIRCLAFFLVVSVHSLSKMGYYGNTVTGEKMFIATLARAIFIVCVPLFLMLSGYLTRTKKLSGNYFKKLGKTYLTYVLAALCCIAYSVWFLEKTVDFKGIAFSILDFTAAPYSWYVEMYIGLFLLTPFLNVLYNNLPSVHWKRVLIAVMVIITALPAVMNVYSFSSLEWWSTPAISGAPQNKLIPSWWTSFYPITYYFIGCYLSEYGLKINKWLNILLIAATVTVSGVYSFWRSYNSSFVWGMWCEYRSFFNVILTTLIFAFFINRNYDKLPKIVSTIISKLSGLCFAGYLVSWIFDEQFYPILIEKVPQISDRFKYYFIIVPLIFTLSLILSYLISKLQQLLELLCTVISKLLPKNRKENKGDDKKKEDKVPISSVNSL